MLLMISFLSSCIFTFIYFNIESQIQKLLDRSKINMYLRKSENKISDLFDGVIYKKFSKNFDIQQLDYIFSISNFN